MLLFIKYVYQGDLELIPTTPTSKKKKKSSGINRLKSAMLSKQLFEHSVIFLKEMKLSYFAFRWAWDAAGRPTDTYCKH